MNQLANLGERHELALKKEAREERILADLHADGDLTLEAIGAEAFLTGVGKLNLELLLRLHGAIVSETEADDAKLGKYIREKFCDHVGGRLEDL